MKDFVTHIGESVSIWTEETVVGTERIPIPFDIRQYPISTDGSDHYSLLVCKSCYPNPGQGDEMKEAKSQARKGDSGKFMWERLSGKKMVKHLIKMHPKLAFLCVDRYLTKQNAV
jgi:hypothetical protein